MSGFGFTLKELINPNWVRHSAVPPMEAGLRPNQDLDRANVVATSFEVDDMAALPDGSVVLAHGAAIHRFRDDSVGEVLARLGAPVTALAAHGSRVVAAVEGEGLIEVADDGRVSVCHAGADVSTCVTAIAALPDGSLAVTIGSTVYPYDNWKQAMVSGDRTGRVLLVSDGSARVVAEGLPWPAGVSGDGQGRLMVCVANAHRIDSIDVKTGRVKPLLRNLPAYPGRIVRSGERWLVAFPYVRNRLSELLLEERDFVNEMVKTISPQEWMVPRLRDDNPYTSALQLGQLRVLGVLKPWAPARSYGLLGVLEGSGRFVASHHSRVDGHQHGVTSAVPTPSGTLVAVRGSRNLVVLREEKS